MKFFGPLNEANENKQYKCLWSEIFMSGDCEAREHDKRKKVVKVRAQIPSWP
jgi:hypothetical protein